MRCSCDPVPESKLSTVVKADFLECVGDVILDCVNADLPSRCNCTTCHSVANRLDYTPFGGSQRVVVSRPSSISLNRHVQLHTSLTRELPFPDVPGQKFGKSSCRMTADHSFQHVSRWVYGLIKFSFSVSISDATMAHLSAPPSLPANSEFFRRKLTGRMARSTGLVSRSMRPSSRNRLRAVQRPRA